MNLFIIVFAIIIILLTIGKKDKKETYYNMFGDYFDAPFIEMDDKRCRKLCNNMLDCTGYTYDPLTERCLLHDNKNGYLKPYENHALYPYYDDYLYKNYWWLYGPSWLNDVDYNMGYRRNVYGDKAVHQRKNVRDNVVGIIDGRIGHIGGLPGGGHGGRVHGAMPSGNTV
jgi:hypothetical protein